MERGEKGRQTRYPLVIIDYGLQKEEKEQKKAAQKEA